MHNVKLPVKINDRYTCQGIDRDGHPVVFDDLLRVDDRVATFTDDEGNRFGPHGVVVRRSDGLWVVPESPATNGSCVGRPELSEEGGDRD